MVIGLPKNLLLFTFLQTAKLDDTAIRALVEMQYHKAYGCCIASLKEDIKLGKLSTQFETEMMKIHFPNKRVVDIVRTIFNRLRGKGRDFYYQFGARLATGRLAWFRMSIYLHFVVVLDCKLRSEISSTK